MEKKLINEKIAKKLERYNLKIGHTLKPYTTFKIGGDADYFVEPESEQDIIDILKIARENSLDTFVMGNGSNLLISDKGIRGIVIHLGKNYSSYKINDNIVTVQSGMSNKSLSRILVEKSLSGYEFASGIPGTIGGGAAMNAGAYEHSVSEVISRVRLCDKDGNIHNYSVDDMKYHHRSSVVLEKEMIILSVTYEFERGNKEEIEKKIAEYEKKRADKQPLSSYSAGSAFKRPKGSYASKLIQDAGLKGYTNGKASVSSKHSGFVINEGDATCEDVIKLLNYVKKVVKDKYKVTLEEEIRIVGDF